MPKKQYGSAADYEKKLKTVMERMDAENYNYDIIDTRHTHGAWVEFWINGQMYRFDHDSEKAAARGISISYGSDCFAQIVLALEDLARISKRGIYELQTWITGMKYLPAPEIVPDCLLALGFEEVPTSIEEIKTRFKMLAKDAHPDGGGTEERFAKLRGAADQAIKFLEGRK